MPKQVFVQFSDVTWQVPGCEMGVLPMEPCEHQWIINNATAAKAQRRGYRLIPDYACRAFMMQGRTVEAMFADCGEVLTLIGLNEMVAAYVALSRVEKHKDWCCCERSRLTCSVWACPLDQSVF
jgi:hypothetical protein